GVQFTDSTTTTITNNTGADATARFRITAPTAAASSSTSSGGSSIGTLIDEEPVVFTSNELKTFTHTDDTAEMRSVYIEKQIDGASVATTISKEVTVPVTNLTVTGYGGQVYHNINYSKFGASSIYFGGSNDYLEVTPTTDFHFGNSAFTVEFWIKMPDLTLEWISLIQFSGPSLNSDMDFVLGYHSGSSNGGFAWHFWGVPDPGDQKTLVPIADNDWHHVALVRNGTSCTLFVDGIDAKTNGVDSAIVLDGFTSIKIGAGDTGWSGDYMGYMDEIRISSTARYTANFTPATAAFEHDASTALLIHSDDAHTSTTFVDSATITTALTTVGETVLDDIIDLTAVYSLTQTALVASDATTAFSYDNGTSWTAFSADHGTLTVPSGSTQGKIKVNITAGGSFSSIDFTKNSAPYWELDTFEDWGVEFESGTTTKVTNRTGGDATARIRITAPTASAGGTGGGATSSAEHFDVNLVSGASQDLTLTTAHDNKALVHAKKFIPGADTTDIN
ncbi:MAG TPA: LamG domain-containing protein, partial [Candidatus Poseidoniales archaeon]|nr:LamG domain-containing protein [Candidatus Poseidoniales archaeon]